MHSMVSEATRQLRIDDAFANADADSDGRLCRGDVKVAWIELFGYKPCRRELDLIMHCWPTDEFVTLDTFRRLASARMSRLDADGQLRHAFAALDSGGRNFLRAEDLRRAVGLLAPRLAAGGFAVDRAFAEVDADADAESPIGLRVRH
uniref:EF-hand domain-containing protein n=1 Tax=Macrostomum lignano TaxID=282301 RepID=A0A1I8FSD5_9PLAT